MNAKLKTSALVAMIAILAISVVAISEMPGAEAKKDHDDDSGHSSKKKTKFHDDREDSNQKQSWFRFFKKPDFESSDCIITGFAENNLPADAREKIDCQVKAWLDNRGKALEYKIKIAGMELVDSNSDENDDIDGSHIHHESDTSDHNNPTGPHQLNVFGNPGFDDSDVVLQPVQGIIRGVWTDSDENTSYGEPDNSHKLSDNLQLLCEGKVFVAVHGEAIDNPDTGHHAAYVKMSLEPTKYGESDCKRILH